ncbi:hypothetical protein MAM1_0133d06197 [Mucor ambiguus]|uniref:Uncharacterized protein n=1 Tax=Mucor ambiguus TaxID=91626 RepID=A0A0C9MHC2_9FUNG|nr:hypothetical protein MAM1_0133d06197 [Mucor ambiguus]
MAASLNVPMPTAAAMLVAAAVAHSLEPDLNFLLGHANILLDIATNDSFKDENEGDSVDSKANNNVTANAVEAKVINGHAEQKAIDQIMLPYLQLQITAKFEYI